MTKYYVDSEGNYLGGFSDGNKSIPKYAIEVDNAPIHANLKYINGRWVESSEQIIKRLESSIDRYLDNQANAFRYESIRTMVTYENDPNPKFNTEGVGAKAFRSAVYTLGVNLIGEVQSGLREVPTEQELLALMPKLEDFVIY